MVRQDLHLSANAIRNDCVSAIEALGFREDIFRECENCSPTAYHATFRDPQEKLTDVLWQKVIAILHQDSEFNGSLEQEQVVQMNDDRLSVSGVKILNALPTQPCPALVRKACDVHAAIRLSDEAAPTLAWLRTIGMASFAKERSLGTDRVFTATFLDMVSGDRFMKFIEGGAPRTPDIAFKTKMEKTVRIWRSPEDAKVLPITYTGPLGKWLEAHAK